MNQIPLLIDNGTKNVVAVNVQTDVLHRVSFLGYGLFMVYHNLITEWDTRPFYFTSSGTSYDFGDFMREKNDNQSAIALKPVVSQPCLLAHKISW